MTAIAGLVNADNRSLFEEWLNRRKEDPLEPALPIIDPHHHLRDWGKSKPADHYLFDDLRRDVSSGHNIRATVVVECDNNMYRASGPPELRAVGETEFFCGNAAMFASGKYGQTLGCAGIVGFAELKLGARVEPVLDAQMAAAGGRLRGIRCPVVWDESEEVRPLRVGEKGKLLDRNFRQGYSCLAPRQLSFDAWVFHDQLPELLDLARAFPASTLIIDHCGGPLTIGPYAGKRNEVFQFWSTQLRELAQCPGVFMKLGGLGSPRSGFGFEKRDIPPSSAELAQAWRPYIETCIEIFGPQRCMFESNFPPDKESCSYNLLWNAFKHIAAAYSPAEKADLFIETAARVYRLDHIFAR